MDFKLLLKQKIPTFITSLKSIKKTPTKRNSDWPEGSFISKSDGISVVNTHNAH